MSGRRNDTTSSGNALLTGLQLLRTPSWAKVHGDIDMECGPTTRTVPRQKQVSFSAVFFIATANLLVARASLVQSYRDLTDGTIVVASGTTNEAALHELADSLHLLINIIWAADHLQTFALLRVGKT